MRCIAVLSSYSVPVLTVACPDGSWGNRCGLQCSQTCEYSCDDLSGDCTGEITITIHTLRNLIG